MAPSRGQGGQKSSKCLKMFTPPGAIVRTHGSGMRERSIIKIFEEKLNIFTTVSYNVLL